MDISVSVTNNMSRAYDGWLRVFVAELISSFGWEDPGGNLYNHPFLDFAFNQNIVINPGETWNGEASWVGADHNTGYGDDFGSITPGNIKVIAGVYENVGHSANCGLPGMPSYFTAYYLDDSVTAFPEYLSADIYEIPITSGIANLYLCGGKEVQQRQYLLMGSVSGTSPGTPLPGGLTLPVNWDLFSNLIFSLLNTPFYSNFFGVMDMEGHSVAQVNLPGLMPSAIGVVMYFAYCTGNPFDFVSNPIELTIVP